MTVAREALRARLGVRRVIDLSAGWLAEAAGGDARSRATPSAPGPRARGDRLAARSGPGDLFVGLPGASADGGEFAAAGARRPAPGACSSAEHATPRGRRGELGQSARTSVIAAHDPLRGAPALARAWRRELGARVVGVTGSTGKTSTKDILARAAARLSCAHAREPRELEHRDRAAADDARGRARHRGAGARDGDARRGPDRRARRDRGAGRGRDRERRAGAPRAARHGRARRRRQGGADPRPARRRRLRRARQRAAARRRTCATTSTPVTFGPGGDVRLRRLRRRARARSRRAGDGSSSSCRYSRAAQPAQHARRGGRGAGARGDAGGAPSTCGSRRCAARSWSSPGGVTVVNDCYNANPMSMRAALDHLAESPAERRVAVLGDDGRARPGLGPLPPRDRRARGASSASTCCHRWARRRSAYARGLRRRDAPGGDARGGRRAARGAGRGPATACCQGLALGRAWSGCSRRSRMLGEILIAGMASLLICMFLGPKFIDFLRAQRVRPADPRGGPGRATTARRARRRWAASLILPRRLRAVPDPGRLPSGRAWRVLGTALAMRRARLRRRLDEARASAARSACRAGRSCSCRRLIAIALWLVVTKYVGTRRTRSDLRDRRRLGRTSATSTRC